MALVGYDSSDEEEEVPPPVVQQSKPQDIKQAVTQKSNAEPSTSKAPPAPSEVPKDEPPPEQPEGPSVIGPMPQPGAAAGPGFAPLAEAEEDDEGGVGPSGQAAGSGVDQPPGSPYTASRALVRDLTLPTVPNLDIPPSPPGSPPPGASKKFEQFLELKKKGVHFNSKLAASPALKNPGLMDKLLDFVGVGQAEQYRTTLGTGLWAPEGFPPAAFKEALKKSQAEVAQARSRPRGGPVEFVAATTAGAGERGAAGAAPQPAGTGAAQQASSTGKRKTRFDN